MCVTCGNEDLGLSEVQQFINNMNAGYTGQTEELFCFNMVIKNQQLFIRPSIRFFEKHRIDRLCQESESGCELKDKALEYILGFDWRFTKNALEQEFRLDRSQIGKQLVYEYSTSEFHEEITPSKSSFFLVQ
ncbi:Hypothetical_protein [Hexamita inflata]|uniref:Hypothetical_protein n=1 Tax=Hexamita inflata TaxID=28002 RepID=A0ABP1HJG7_9EUKA